mmetsp:Transcript_19471/g.66775  ORF Transcript_19471/g.66775 Transcript_19471/m.66775 type:complete len:268 (+) Transcript_19471:969-1772(+)
MLAQSSWSFGAMFKAQIKASAPTETRKSSVWFPPLAPNRGSSSSSGSSAMRESQHGGAATSSSSPSSAAFGAAAVFGTSRKPFTPGVSVTSAVAVADGTSTCAHCGSGSTAGALERAVFARFGTDAVGAPDRVGASSAVGAGASGRLVNVSCTENARLAACAAGRPPPSGRRTLSLTSSRFLSCRAAGATSARRRCAACAACRASRCARFAAASAASPAGVDAACALTYPTSFARRPASATAAVIARAADAPSGRGAVMWNASAEAP